MPVLLAYGSLLADLPAGRRATLPGHRLTWGVAMDNAVDEPGYKAYLDAAGTRPAVRVCFLDVEPDPEARAEGALLDVGEADWPALDARERNYVRAQVEVVGADGSPRRAWTYLGRPEARGRALEGARTGTAVVAASYLERVVAARTAHGLSTPPLPAGVRPAALRPIELP